MRGREEKINAGLHTKRSELAKREETIQANRKAGVMTMLGSLEANGFALDVDISTQRGGARSVGDCCARARSPAQPVIRRTWSSKRPACSPCEHLVVLISRCAPPRTRLGGCFGDAQVQA